MQAHPLDFHIFNCNSAIDVCFELVEVQIGAPRSFHSFTSFLLHDAEMIYRIIAWPSDSVKCRLMCAKVLLFLCDALRRLCYTVFPAKRSKDSKAKTRTAEKGECND